MQVKRSLLNGLAERLPADVLFESQTIADFRSELYPSEYELVRTAVFQRQCEFSTGRQLARRMLKSAGVMSAAITKGPLGEPLWPDGIRGSVSHSGETCVVMLAPSENYIGLGVDIEFDHIAEGALDLVLTKAERTEFPSPELARLAFSAKEAFYKAVASHHGKLIDFHEVEIRADFQSQDFHVVSNAVDPLYTDIMRGIFASSAAATLAVCWLDRPPV